MKKLVLFLTALLIGCQPDKSNLPKPVKLPRYTLIADGVSCQCNSYYITPASGAVANGGTGVLGAGGDAVSVNHSPVERYRIRLFDEESVTAFEIDRAYVSPIVDLLCTNYIATRN